MVHPFSTLQANQQQHCHAFNHAASESTPARSGGAAAAPKPPAGAGRQGLPRPLHPYPSGHKSRGAPIAQSHQPLSPSGTAAGTMQAAMDRFDDGMAAQANAPAASAPSGEPEAAGAAPDNNDADQKASTSAADSVPVYVMLPLDTVNADGVFRYASSRWFNAALQQLKDTGIHGVAVDVWVRRTAACTAPAPPPLAHHHFFSTTLLEQSTACCGYAAVVSSSSSHVAKTALVLQTCVLPKVF